MNLSRRLDALEVLSLVAQEAQDEAEKQAVLLRWQHEPLAVTYAEYARKAGHNPGLAFEAALDALRQAEAENGRNSDAVRNAEREVTRLLDEAQQAAWERSPECIAFRAMSPEEQYRQVMTDWAEMQAQNRRQR
jgi:hypothetical protein